MITRRTACAGFLAAAIGLSTTSPTSAVPPAASDAPTIYRLSEASTYQTGCYDPCDCLLMEPVPVRGTFTVKRVDSNPMFDTYDLEQARWVVSLPDSELHVTGRGVYQIGGEVAYLQRLEMDLEFSDGTPPTHFDSGWQDGAGAFPAIVISISINGMKCNDTVFSIHAKPVAAKQITRYRLARDSTYQQGCFDPCDCILWEQQPMSGSFDIVPVVNWGTYREYAVHNVRWFASGGNVPLDHDLRGSGTYTSIDGFAGPMHQLELDLSIDGGDPPTHFDSGLLNTNAQFPEIDIVATMNNMVCYDIVLDVHAKPSRPPFAGFASPRQ